MNKRLRRVTTIGMAIATCIGVSGCVAYDDGYYPAAVPARPVYVYPHAYYYGYYGAPYRHEGHWRHSRGWRGHDRD